MNKDRLIKTLGHTTKWLEKAREYCLGDMTRREERSLEAAIRRAKRTLEKETEYLKEENDNG